MITGHKPSGYFVTSDGEGHKIEGETRQCVHCGYTWEYKPGSGDRRGWCIACNGFVCARDECMKMQLNLQKLYQFEAGKTKSCVPFEEWNDHLRKRLRMTG